MIIHCTGGGGSRKLLTGTVFWSYGLSSNVTRAPGCTALTCDHDQSRSIAAAAAATLAGGAAMAAAAPAWADHGPGSVYNIELSANLAGKDGGGAWIWIQLQANGTGEYQGSDCGHGQAPATPDSGPVTWSSSDGQLTISPVVLNGLGGFPATVTVPAAYGHYTGALGTYITLPFPADNIGTSQLQVAP